MKRCGKFTKSGNMTEERPCLRPLRHRGGHTPNLVGLQLGDVTVVSRAPDYISGSGHQTCWNVKDRYNHIRKVPAHHLMSGYFKGNCAAKGSGKGSCNGKGKPKPEYATVIGHWHLIFKATGSRHRSYHGMPFCDKWNPKKGGSPITGMQWIIDNLGPKPGPTWSMDIIEHAKGFVPGNLRWAQKRKQKDNQQHRVLGKYSVKELQIELKRHGYGIHKIRKSLRQ